MLNKYLPTLYLLGFLVCAALIASAYYFEYVMFLDPCPMCMAQRIATILVGVGCLGAFVLRRWPYAEIAALVWVLLFSALGVYLADHHVWLQHLPEDKVPECGPGLEYMLQTFPLKDVLMAMLQGDGECAKVSWSWLGMSMPEWMRVVFAVYTLAAVVALVNRRKSSSTQA